MPGIDYAIFNELSVDDCSTDAGSLGAAVRMFIELFRNLGEIGFKKIRTPNDFLSREVGGATIQQVAKGLGFDELSLILSITDSPHSCVDEGAFFEMNVKKVQDLESPGAEGVVCALISYLRVEYTTVGEDLAKDIPHASQRSEVLSSLVEISRISSPEKLLQPNRDLPLPNARISDLLVENWEALFKSISLMESGEKIATLKALAFKVARINGYTEDERLSSINSRKKGKQRQVFRSEFVSQTLYLSTDFEKFVGAFEVHDAKGKHLGEWLFSGKLNGGPDHTGKHDLLMK